MSSNLEQPELSSEGRWTPEEHSKFKEGLRIHGKNWKKVTELVGTRTIAQVRSHAQKYFIKQKKKQKSRMKLLASSFSSLNSSSNLYMGWLYHSTRAAQLYSMIRSDGVQSNQATLHPRPETDT